MITQEFLIADPDEGGTIRLRKEDESIVVEVREPSVGLNEAPTYMVRLSLRRTADLRDVLLGLYPPMAVRAEG